MASDGASSGVLPDVVERPDTEDSRREPDTALTRQPPEVHPDDTTVYVWGPDLEADLLMVEGVGPFGHTAERRVGTTTFRYQIRRNQKGSV